MNEHVNLTISVDTTELDGAIKKLKKAERLHQKLSSTQTDGYLNVTISTGCNSMDELEECVKRVSKIQKEYKCNCTLSVTS